MKLTKIDKNILELLIKKSEGYTQKDIVIKTGEYKTSIIRRLQQLEKHSIVTRIRSSCSIYKFNFKSNQNFNFIEVECPKCKVTKLIHDFEQYVSCKNPECITKSGNKTRFWITKTRIIQKNSLLRL